MSTCARNPIALTRGAGCRVWDTDGRAYLDFAAGIATCTLGHAHPASLAANVEFYTAVLLDTPASNYVGPAPA